MNKKEKVPLSAESPEESKYEESFTQKSIWQRLIHYFVQWGLFSVIGSGILLIFLSFTKALRDIGYLNIIIALMLVSSSDVIQNDVVGYSAHTGTVNQFIEPIENSVFSRLLSPIVCFLIGSFLLVFAFIQ